MAIRTKGKRPIRLNDRTYWWFVRNDGDTLQPVLIVLTFDKQFRISYRLGQGETAHWAPQWIPTAEVIGVDFGKPRLPNRGQIVATPIWKDDTVATPAFVRRLVEWALSGQEAKQETDRPT